MIGKFGAVRSLLVHYYSEEKKKLRSIITVIFEDQEVSEILLATSKTRPIFLGGKQIHIRAIEFTGTQSQFFGEIRSNGRSNTTPRGTTSNLIGAKIE